MIKWLLTKCWFRNTFLGTPCNTPFCCVADECFDCDEEYGERR
jgi:hypothetical protein